ncbi:MAG: DEAD/DEAH box helicase [Candidatus Saelkia tenebricola]|nr:DEAD/DEAH box helicase [Candidatus Saelkia tenebricola]
MELEAGKQIKIAPFSMKYNKKITLQTDIQIPPDFDYNKEFKKAFNMMETSDKNIFITGKAGTGKSTLLEYFRINTEKKIAVLAPTGVSAIKIRGQTIHSFFRFPPRLIQKQHIKRLRNKNLINNIEAIVIDEASMLRADLLDAIDYSLRLNRSNNIPFGNVQLIIFGDLFQLPPVVESEAKELMADIYKSPYFFSAKVFKEIDLEYIELKKNYRQKDDDFIELLNKIRVKRASKRDIDFLNRQLDYGTDHNSTGIVTLTTTNNQAKNININYLNKIDSQEYQYDAEISPKFKESSYPVEAKLRLKKGAQVMLVRNDSLKRWVNGTIAEIISLTQSDIKVAIGENVYKVPKVSWEKIEYSYNSLDDKIEEEIVGSFQQYPIKLAWAITIHKSQGQTFNDVIIDMGFGAFTHGQTYVALSRCTTLEGILLKSPITHSDIIFDDRVYQFQKSFKNKKGELKKI